jgi:ribosome-binding ATPase YchF (GTP1/OBG family)
VSLAVSGKVEEELSALGPEDRVGFARELGIDRSGLDRLIEASYRMLGLVTFYTAATDLQAWTVPVGTPAHAAAGRIHTDFQRGFIRAEVIPFDDLVTAGSEHHAREQGHLRAEGRDYVVRDGDVIRFLFNV